MKSSIKRLTALILCVALCLSFNIVVSAAGEGTYTLTQKESSTSLAESESAQYFTITLEANNPIPWTGGQIELTLSEGLTINDTNENASLIFSYLNKTDKSLSKMEEVPASLKVAPIGGNGWRLTSISVPVCVAAGLSAGEYSVEMKNMTVIETTDNMLAESSTSFTHKLTIINENNVLSKVTLKQTSVEQGSVPEVNEVKTTGNATISTKDYTIGYYTKSGDKYTEVQEADLKAGTTYYLGVTGTGSYSGTVYAPFTVTERTTPFDVKVDSETETGTTPEPEKKNGATIDNSLNGDGAYKVEDSAETLRIDTSSTGSQQAFEAAVKELIDEIKVEDVVEKGEIEGLTAGTGVNSSKLYYNNEPVSQIEFTTKVAPKITINGMTSGDSGNTATFNVEIGLVATKTAKITLADQTVNVPVGKPDQPVDTSGMKTKMTFTIVLPSFFANKQTFGIHNDTEEVYNGTPADGAAISFQSTLSPFTFTNKVGAVLTKNGTKTNYGTAEGALVYAVNGDTVEIKVAANNQVTVPSNKTGVILVNSTGATLTLVGSGINLTQTSLASGASYTVAAKKSSGTVTPNTSNNSTRYVSGGGGTGTAGVRTDIEIKPGATPTTPSGTVSNVGNFTDVKSNDWFAAPVLWAVNKGITNGVGDNRFDPNGSCTRGQMVTFLWRAAGSPDAAANGRFKDVDANAYYAKAVAWAVANGITDGKGATDTFAPNDQVTRAEAVTFLSRALKGSGSGSSNFNDVPGNSWFAASVGWAVSNGITNGMGDNQFQPNGLCTRAQTVTFLYRAYGNK